MANAKAVCNNLGDTTQSQRHGNTGSAGPEHPRRSLLRPVASSTVKEVRDPDLLLPPPLPAPVHHLGVLRGENIALTALITSAGDSDRADTGAVGFATPKADELRLIARTLLRLSKLSGQAVGRNLVALVAACRQLYLSQGDKTVLLDAPVTPGHTFGPVVDGMLQRSHRVRESAMVRLLSKRPPPVRKQQQQQQWQSGLQWRPRFQAPQGQAHPLPSAAVGTPGPSNQGFRGGRRKPRHITPKRQPQAAPQMNQP
ncbi:UNVERIFIED_CONTAM: hypothetical protein FKN15_016859 [Acipenser sinensis]